MRISVFDIIKKIYNIEKEKIIIKIENLKGKID
jgi:hypothetical protein